PNSRNLRAVSCDVFCSRKPGSGLCRIVVATSISSGPRRSIASCTATLSASVVAIESPMSHSEHEATVRVGLEKPYTKPQASCSLSEEFLKGIQLAFFLDVFQPSADVRHQCRIGANGQRFFPTIECIRAHDNRHWFPIARNGNFLV